MTQLKTILMTAAVLAAPAVAFAQVSTDAVTDTLKDKAVEGVLDNLTTDDALVAGKTVLKGGSKEDAAVAVVKNRAEDKIEGVTDTKVDLDDLSKEGMIDTGKDIAVEKAKGSASKYTDGAPSAGGLSTGSAIDAGKSVVIDKAKGSASTYEAPVIQKSGITSSAPTSTVTTPAAAPVNCPAGTKDAGDGTCMITGDWKF